MEHKAVTFVLFLTIVSASASTFRNVTVLLTTQLTKLFVYGETPIVNIFISNSKSLQNYINSQPFEVLTIRDDNIQKLEKDSVVNLPNIQHINIVSSKVQEISPGAFKNLPKLEGLNLGFNSIEEIKNGVFTGLGLTSLYLNDNKISKIEDKAFNNMTMTLINLDNNRITRWDSNWFVGSPVGSIYIANNLIEVLPEDAFHYGEDFKRLNVPLIIWNLNLAQNRLRKVQVEAFKHINAIGYLNLSNNYLHELPKNVFKTVKSVSHLDLENNRVENVDGVFDDINIDQLVLRNNSLACFPEEVFEGSTIGFIFLDGNPVTCKCVEKWKDRQVKSGVWVLYNMKSLEDSCVEKQ